MNATLGELANRLRERLWPDKVSNKAKKSPASTEVEPKPEPIELRLPAGWDCNTTENLDQARSLKRCLDIVSGAKDSLEYVAGIAAPLDQTTADFDRRPGHLVVVDQWSQRREWRYDASLHFGDTKTELLGGESLTKSFYEDFNETRWRFNKVEPRDDGSVLISHKSLMGKRQDSAKVEADQKVEIGRDGTLRLIEDANPPR